MTRHSKQVNRRSGLSAGRILLLAVLFLVRAGADTPPAPSIAGAVADPSGAAIAGARIAAASAGGGAATTGSGPRGEFALVLAPGEYTLRVSADGFAGAAVTVRAPGAGTETIAIRLQLLPVREAVTVTQAAPYQVVATRSATRTATPLLDVPQAVAVVTRELIRDQSMMSIADVVRYLPGVTAIQGENNRDQVVIRGNSSSADFFVNGVRDDVQYYRDLYNVESVEALKGPNAMVFGRGGGGGAINRVTKDAGPARLSEIAVQGGSFDDRRFAADFNQPAGDRTAVRLNSVYEKAASFRNGVGLERYGVAPNFWWAPSARTRLTAGYEYFRDARTADRGIPSRGGRPAALAVGTFVGNPDDSRVRAGVHAGAVALEHQFARVHLRNRTHVADYDKFYRNYVPGAVDAAGARIALSAYDNSTGRRNVFHQTDVTWSASTGPIRHTLLWGAEAGRQRSDNFRQTGYFGGATSTSVAYADPLLRAPAAFRQSATDADNRVVATVGATYVQDQVQLARWLQAIAGFRFDRFDLNFRNRRTGERLSRPDRLASPRAGLVFKPSGEVSLYGNYSVSWLPSAGDQFASLTTVTQQVQPEKFTNYELGAKWDLRRQLSLTSAVYRLDRTNTRAVDPNDPARIVQTGSQRSQGLELGATGNLTPQWRIAGGYAWQHARITSATAAARAGAVVAQAPRHTFSLWNHYQVRRRVSVGFGVHNRSEMYAAVDNTVVLPGYTRADAAVFYAVSERVRFQANVQNALDRRYYVNADGNNNISPGSPRTVRLGLVARF
jgi:catecholate siderophore receptor